MQDKTEAKIKQDLIEEIQNLEQNYSVIKSFLSGKDYDNITIGQSVQSFKDSLSRASAFVLALYNLKGKRVNIPGLRFFTEPRLCFSNDSGFFLAKTESSSKNYPVNV